MDLLLDTHAFIWFMNGDNQLSTTVRDLIVDTNNKCFLSIASVWEIAIKSSLNKLDLHGDFDRIAQFINANDMELLPITFEHVQGLLRLDFHHRDPFDRIIIAQAFGENLTIATKDVIFYSYGVNIIWK